MLSQNNIARDGLQIAWDFTVASTSQQTERFIYMRDDAFERIPYPDGVKYRVTEVFDDWKPGIIRRKILGRMTLPWYLNSYAPGTDVRLVTGILYIHTHIRTHLNYVCVCVFVCIPCFLCAYALFEKLVT